ncbi:MAG: hypothetical protein HKN84_09350 [Gammaproteobacteria bacterium]|nr:hypothetical protein [Gammaproteobacteria bacterium]
MEKKAGRLEWTADEHSTGKAMTPEQREQAVHEVRVGLAGGFTEIVQLFSVELTDRADAPFGDAQTLTAKQLADVVDRAQYQAMLSVANADTDSGAYDDACMYASVLIETGAIRGSHRAPKWLMDFVRGVLNGRIKRPPKKGSTPYNDQDLAVYLVVRGLQDRYGIPLHGGKDSSIDSAFTIVAEAMGKTPEAVESVYTHFRDRLEGKEATRRP